MTVVVRPVEPAADAALITGWVSVERASFWGMAGLGRAEVEEIYTYIQEQEHLAAYLLVLDDVPVGLFQTYDPQVDEIGGFYDRREGDVGVHLLLADDERRSGRTAEVLAAGLDFVAHLPGCRRIVFEPDARNHASIALMERLGAERGPLVDLRTSISEKPAQFFFLDRDRALALVGRSPRS
ncbi:penicillin amidase [Nocardioides aromaticivorans]|uniref:Lysine N-acyltransferase MbtK n=1 Tax=Nocardioides aromaticivorans TaxID=200618 RepID=A0A7Y9ZHZ0_9ACTN|nr:GNAT family N-acetyltransferase [Nocardioides aromaticivorans]NYI45246.1 penicillin amidase [Nocardioides aromaticivorans]